MVNRSKEHSSISFLKHHESHINIKYYIQLSLPRRPNHRKHLPIRSPPSHPNPCSRSNEQPQCNALLSSTRSKIKPQVLRTVCMHVPDRPPSQPASHTARRTDRTSPSNQARILQQRNITTRHDAIVRLVLYYISEHEPNNPNLYYTKETRTREKAEK